MSRWAEGPSGSTARGAAVPGGPWRRGLRTGGVARWAAPVWPGVRTVVLRGCSWGPRTGAAAHRQWSPADCRSGPVGLRAGAGSGLAGRHGATVGCRRRDPGLRRPGNGESWRAGPQGGRPGHRRQLRTGRDGTERGVPTPVGAVPAPGCRRRSNPVHPRGSTEWGAQLRARSTNRCNPVHRTAAGRWRRDLLPRRSRGKCRQWAVRPMCPMCRLVRRRYRSRGTSTRRRVVPRRPRTPPGAAVGCRRRTVRGAGGYGRGGTSQARRPGGIVSDRLPAVLRCPSRAALRTAADR